MIYITMLTVFCFGMNNDENATMPTTKQVNALCLEPVASYFQPRYPSHRDRWTEDRRRAEEQFGLLRRKCPKSVNKPNLATESPHLHNWKLAMTKAKEVFNLLSCKKRPK